MYKSYRITELIMVITGIILVAAAAIYSMWKFHRLEFFDLPFQITASAGVIMILLGVALWITDRHKQIKRVTREKSRRNLKSIVLSYAMVNKEPQKNLKDLHFHLQSEGFTDISLKRLRVLVDRTLTNIRMDMIKPSLKAKLFTEDRKLRRYKFASDHCPKCGVFKNYHKECGFCGYHEMSK